METVREKLNELERKARVLDPPAAARRALLERVTRHSEAFLEGIESMPAYRPPDDRRGKISDFPISEEAADPDHVLGLLRDHVDRWGANVPSGGHMGYIPGGGLYASALGDFLAAVSNRYAGIFFGGPGAVRMEHMLLSWLAGVVGYPETAGGDLTSGGSVANLIGIVTAREAHGITVAEIPRSVVYFSEQAHHSVEKALRIAGLRECAHRRVRLPLPDRRR
jgi:aromatic-L-amino-acid decarboxylase